MAEHGESPQALKSWWANFKKGGKKKPEPAPELDRLVFGVPLQESIKYANVAISLMDERGHSFTYGYVPIVVAKCGVFLKEKATDVEGIFRLSGSAKRINELRQVFDSPHKYGKGLDWTGYTVHDAANVFRRYLNMLPQPTVPLEYYERFRSPLRGHQVQATGDNAAPAQAPDFSEADHEQAIMTYQRLITEIPDLNRQLLLYVLDLLSVFASKSDVNRMTSANLSAIFQPGMLSHPDHNLSPPEYRLSQDVILFLIDNQDSFLIGMSGTAADEQTVRDVQNASAVQPATPGKSSQGGVGRSVSNASAGADSMRKFGGIRRNLSVSSKNSKHSSTAHTPNTPQSGGFGGSGVHRSNTVPSKRSPGLSSTRAPRGVDSPTASVALSPGLSPGLAPPGSRLSPTLIPSSDASGAAAAGLTPTIVQSVGTPPADQSVDGKGQLLSRDGEVAGQDAGHLTVENPPSNKRRGPGLLTKSPSSDGKDAKPPNKLRKKRAPTDPQHSANSSSQSLTNAEYIYALPTPNSSAEKDPIPTTAPRVGDGLENSMGPMTLDAAQRPSELSQQTLKAKSPAGSMHSKSSVTDFSEQDTLDAPKGEKTEKKRHWRFSSAARNHNESTSEASPQKLGGNASAGKSAASMTSANKSRQSLANDGSAAPLETLHTENTQPSTASESSGLKYKETGDDGEQKKGLFGRLKDKVEKSRQDRKGKEAEKERAKSPPRDNAERSGSKHSLSAIAHDPSRSRSIDTNAQQQTTAEPLPTGKAAAAAVSVHRPAVGAPAAELSGAELPVVGKPTTEAPITEKTATETLVSKQNSIETSRVEEPATGRNLEEMPLVSQSTSEQPIAELPAAELPAEVKAPVPTQTGTVTENATKATEQPLQPPGEQLKTETAPTEAYAPMATES